MIAATAQAHSMAVPRTVTMMILASIQDSSNVAGAANWYKWIFVLYIGALVITVVMSLWLGVAGGRLQGAIKKDAEAKIATANATGEQAKRDAAVANERAGIANESAGKANERAEKLEKDN